MSFRLKHFAGQKVGKALVISDNSYTNYPNPPMLFGEMKTMAMADASMPKETLAIGEIEIVSTVTVSFVLE